MALMFRQSAVLSVAFLLFHMVVFSGAAQEEIEIAASVAFTEGPRWIRQATSTSPRSCRSGS